jgi:hypothetical protein
MDEVHGLGLSLGLAFAADWNSAADICFTLASANRTRPPLVGVLLVGQHHVRSLSGRDQVSKGDVPQKHVLPAAEGFGQPCVVLVEGRQVLLAGRRLLERVVVVVIGEPDLLEVIGSLLVAAASGQDEKTKDRQTVTAHGLSPHGCYWIVHHRLTIVDPIV